MSPSSRSSPSGHAVHAEHKKRATPKDYPSGWLDSKKAKAASYSPASHRSTIGAGGLNFSVRNGKRWNPAAITTMCSFGKARTSRAPVCRTWAHKRATRRTCRRRTAETRAEGKEFGQLVALGFAVAGFAPAPYRRPRLGRPSKRSSHLADGFALRCLQRLS